MLATICDDTWNVLKMQHITPNSKRLDYSDIHSCGHKKIKGPNHTVEGGYHLRKAPNPHPRIHVSTRLVHQPLGNDIIILKVYFPNACDRLSSRAPHVKILSGECHSTPLMISQHWFRWWLGAIKQQSVTWANVDLGLCHHMPSLGHNESNYNWYIINYYSGQNLLRIPITFSEHITWIW